MTASAHPLRRGACPALSAPMQTGDGLLVRLAASGIDIGLDQAAELCAAARRHGNGIIEITARGNFQIRGLSAASAGAFADAVAALGIDAGTGVAILVDPLAGLAPAPAVDGREIAKRLRRALAASPFAASLGAKVSCVIDGGFALHLDSVAADIRLRVDGTRWHVAVGGDAGSARGLGWVDAADAVEAALRLLRVIAQHGPLARAKDLLGADGPQVLAAAIAELMCETKDQAPLHIPPPHQRVHARLTPRYAGREQPAAHAEINQPLAAARPRAEPIGSHLLRDHSLALGVGPAFGHTDATALVRLIETARNNGVHTLRTAPGRALLFIGLTQDTVRPFVTTAERLGFITHRDDPRRHVAACAGAPVCASAEIPARMLAPLVTAAAATLLDGSLNLHLSGCRKGCAHPARSTLTIVGSQRGCELIIDGTSTGAAHAVVATEELLLAIARVDKAVAQTRGESSAAAAFARLGPAQVANLFGAADD